MTRTRPDWGTLEEARVALFGYLRARPELWSTSPITMVEWYLGHMLLTKRSKSMKVAIKHVEYLCHEAQDWVVRNKEKPNK